MEKLKYIKKIPPKQATGELKKIYDMIGKSWSGPMPGPWLMLASTPELLNVIWINAALNMFSGSLKHDEWNVIAASISKMNRCPYCLEAHGMLIDAYASNDTAKYIEMGRIDRIEDPYFKSLAEWSFSTTTKAPIISNPPFNIDKAPEAIMTVLSFHLINRMVNIFLYESGMPVPELFGLKKLMASLAKPMMRKMIDSMVFDEKELLSLAPMSTLPADMPWAKTNRRVAEAVTRQATAFERVGNETVPKPVRDLLNHQLEFWDGNNVSASQEWINDTLSKLDDGLKPIGKLVLLTAFASYKVDKQIVEDVQIVLPGDSNLVKTVAYASFATARKIAQNCGDGFHKKLLIQPNNKIAAI